LKEEKEEATWRVPKLVFYFAKKDHWVDDATREAIVKTRGNVDAEANKRNSWPRIKIDESGTLVHGWCIDQSKEVAEKVQEWIEDIIE